MKDILNFERREQLYKFLIDDFGFILIDEWYSHESFGNFLITLSAKEFFLRYINDRSFLTIEITSRSKAPHWYDLSFIKDLIYSPDKMNADEREMDNCTRIEELNDFLRKDFDRISELFSKRIYPTMQQRLDELLKEQFKRRFP